MPTKPRYFHNKYVYHVYNRGIEKRTIFETAKDYYRFLDTVSFYLYEQKVPFSEFLKLSYKARAVYLRHNPPVPENLRVGIISFCLIPNHFHIILQQEIEDGITKFISDTSNSYAKYFNKKYRRTGKLFEGPFKAKEIPNEQSLLQVSRYIHLNPIYSSTVKLKERIDKYPYSSYINWKYERSDRLINISKIKKLVNFEGKEYEKFVESKLESDPRIGIEDYILES